MAWILSWKDLGESPSQGEANEIFFQNEDQSVDAMTLHSTVQVATPELGPCSVFCSQNHYKCQQNEHYISVPEQNIWKKRHFFLSKGTNYS
jgi:hypothetical protein